MESVGNLWRVWVDPMGLGRRLDYVRRERYKSRKAEDWVLVSFFASLCHRYLTLASLR
jgi:hypothetical protein